MLLRQDLRAADAPPDMEIIQLTHGDLPSSHVYMEAQIFAPDSNRFWLHESATPHGSDRTDPRHRYLVCDPDDNFSLSPATTEIGATAPSVSPIDGHVFYFVDETEIDGGRLTLERVRFDGSDRQTILVIDAPLPGVGRRPSRIYPLSTMRSDGAKLALPCFFGDGQSDEQPWGLMVFDLAHSSVELIMLGREWCNMHAQYCRSRAPEHMRDILVQENHGSVCTKGGEIVQLVGGAGADIHVIRDDGQQLRDMPWGRDGNEHCQGHQCWRGATPWAITSTSLTEPAECRLIESQALAHTGHHGAASIGAVRNELSRSHVEPRFFHFATDAAGKRLVTDTGPSDRGGRVFAATLGRPGQDALSSWTCLAQPRSSWKKEAHIHPFLSPDGTTVFFNSDESGICQAYMIRGLGAA